MDTKLKILSQLIKDGRKKKHLTQQKLAGELFLSEAYIKDLERGRTTPSVSTLMDLIRILNIDVEPFFYPVPVNDSSYQELVRLLSQLDSSDYKILIATATALLNEKKEKK